MDNSVNDKILNELQKIAKLLVLDFSKDFTQTKSIETMSKVGFKPKEIAELLGTSSNTVSVTLSKKRNKK